MWVRVPPSAPPLSLNLGFNSRVKFPPGLLLFAMAFFAVPILVLTLSDQNEVFRIGVLY